VGIEYQNRRISKDHDLEEGGALEGGGWPGWAGRINMVVVQAGKARKAGRDGWLF
jgi:hypothetical protein